MELIDSPELKLKKIARELASHKIELHQIRGYLQCILQNSNDMIFATDVDGILVSFSKGGEKVLGYSWEEIGGYFVKQLCVDPGTFDEIMAMAQEKESAVRLEFPFRHKKGHTVFCDVSLINLTNSKGQRVGTVGVCRDISRWKKLQDDLMRIDRLAEIGRIASGIAHEINNPLAIISEASGWVSEVVEEAKGLGSEEREEIEKAIRQINEQARRCRAITHPLLGLMRDPIPEKKEFDIHELLKETIRFLMPELKYTSIEIVFNFSNEPLLINSDPKMIEQVFVNLISNAVYAVKEKNSDEGLIEIGAYKSDSNIEIKISDNGTGIPEDKQNRVFSLSFTTKPPGKGTGLGLFMCQNIIKKLGGKITFSTQWGVGTTFTIQLPLS